MRTKKINTPLFSAIPLLFLLGCASSWQVSSTDRVSWEGRFRVPVPENWEIKRTGDVLLMTHHGTGFEMIAFERRLVKKPLDHTALRLKPGMRPHELAEIMVANTANSPGLREMSLDTLGVTTLCSKESFKADLSFKTNNVVFKGIAYGFLYDNWYYEITYVAPARFYFDRYKSDFDAVIRGFTQKECDCSANGK